MSFGERLVSAREKCGYNQKQFAEAAGISPTRLNYWEKDKRQPDVFMIKKLCNLLNVSGDYLIENDSFSSESSQVTPDEQQLLTDYRNLNEDGQEYIHKQMEFASSQPDYKKHSPHEKVDKTA